MGIQKSPKCTVSVDAEPMFYSIRICHSDLCSLYYSVTNFIGLYNNVSSVCRLHSGIPAVKGVNFISGSV